MLSTLRQIVGETLAAARRNWRWARYRRAMLDQGVLIDPRARIHGASSIELQCDCRIHGDATITSGSLGYFDRLESNLAGRVTLGRRCEIYPGAIIAAYDGRVELGDDVSVNPGTILYGHGGLSIGSRTRIAARCVIIPANHNFTGDRPIIEQGVTCKGIRIGCDVWLGAGVRVLDGVTLGDGAVIGAGSVVTRSIPAHAVAVGAPARVIRMRTRLAKAA